MYTFRRTPYPISSSACQRMLLMLLSPRMYAVYYFARVKCASNVYLMWRGHESDLVLHTPHWLTLTPISLNIYAAKHTLLYTVCAA